MNTQSPSDDISQADVDRLLAEPALAALVAGGAPLIIAASAPLRVIWANGAAQTVLRAGTLDEIAQRIFFERANVGRLGELARALVPGAPPRLERVRLLIWRRMETLTFLCRRTAGPHPLFVAAAVGVKTAAADVAHPVLTAFSAPCAAESRLISPAPVPPIETGDANAAASQAAIGDAMSLVIEAPAEKAAPPALPRRSAADVCADLAGNFYNAPVVRFLWKSDQRHRLTEITGELCAVIGCEAQRLIGADFLAFAEEFGAEPLDRLVSAFARRETWSGVEILWPIMGADAAAPVTLGALPSFDREKKFEGFRGFGVVHIQRIESFTRAPLPIEANVSDVEEIDVALPTPATAALDVQAQPNDHAIADVAAIIEPVMSPSPKTAAPAEPAPVFKTTVSLARLVSTPVETMAPPLQAPGESPPAVGVNAPIGASEVEAAASPVEPLHVHDEVPVAVVSPVTIAPILTALDETEAPAKSIDAQEPVEAASLETPLADVNDEVDALDLEPLSAPTASAPNNNANVVQLRAAYRVPPPATIQPPAAANDRTEQAQAAPPKSRAPEAPPAEPAAPPHAPEPRKSETGANAMAELTQQERNAFREIARVLGAKAEADADIPKSAPIKQDEFVETSPVDRQRGLRIRDLIDIANKAAPPPTYEPPFVAPAAAITPPIAPAPAPAIAAAAHSQRDSLERNAAAIIDRVPVGVLVSRMEAPIFVNRTLLDLLDFDDADAFHDAGGLDRMFRGRHPQSLSDAAGGGAIPIVTRTGDVLSVIARMQAVEWDGEPASLTTFRATHEADLAPRLRSLEAELRHRDADMRELHAILDTATDGVAVLDADGLILALNKSAEALFGYDQNEVAGENFTILLARESHAAANDYLAGLKVNGVASVLNDGRDVMGRARQGGAIPVFMTLGRVSAAGAQKFCAVLRDMTAWKKAERELSEARREAERASALKSDFLAKVSHEIRTPLNAIIGFAEVIRDERFGPVGNERYKDYLKDIHSSGVHVMSLVNDLLDLSKIEAGKLDLNFGAVDSNKIVAECVSLMQPQATRERIVIRQSLAPRLPNIVADERSLRQIVLNLLSNAVKFNEAGGQVIVSTALTDAGHAVIRIKDTGLGMNETEVQMALEPFRQLHTARGRGGTGLGLPLTKSLVEANRASFTIKSKKLEGTLVEVAFPPTRVLAE